MVVRIFFWYSEKASISGTFINSKQVFMHQSSYVFQQPTVTRYIFTSVGRTRIKKIVDFEELSVKNVYNLGFGDLRPDGSVDDKANSNNGDIIKVLATVITILNDFTTKNPDVHIIFTSSTDERMKLYARILKSHFSAFREKFTIAGLVQSASGYKKLILTLT
jgi:hypothetical protein